MDKSKHFKLLIVLLFAMMANTTNLKGQSSCSSAEILNVSSSFQTSITSSSNNIWYKFQSVGNTLDIEVTSSNSNVSQVELFSGSCTSLVQMKSSSSGSLSIYQLVSGQYYYIKVNLSSSSQSIISITGSCYHCVPTVALSISPNPVCVGDLVIFDISTTNPCNWNVTWDLDGFLPVTALPSSNGLYYYIVSARKP